MRYSHIKPYLYILAFLIFPLLLVPTIKMVKNHFISHQIADEFNNKVHTKNYGLVIHGGAGNITPEYLKDSLEQMYRDKLSEAINLGYQMIENGDSATAIVVAVIKVLEDSPLFNAGKGAVFTHHKTNELDASIMNGIDKNAGAVAGVSHIKNPIEAAYNVMNNSEHVLLSSVGAEKFARTQKMEMVDSKYFYTDKQWQNLKKTLNNEKFGTVGCTVLDKYGNLAAGTSTGGMTNKKFGRIGDSPIIGAGTYADNNTCAISATGHGEYFIRFSVTHDIAARMEYLNESLEQAAKTVIENLKNIGGNGGIVGIDKNGNICTTFNTAGMFRAYKTNKQNLHVAFYKE